MSITLDNSDFQFLQDQLVELKNKNYELTEKNRRGQADFEAAKAKICDLQLKLEEQERDFQVTSTTLRREIEAVSGNGDKENKEEDYKVKYKKLLLKAKEIQQRYEKSIEIVQQMELQVQKLQQENAKLYEELKLQKEAIEVRENEDQTDIKSAMIERDNLKQELDRVNAELANIESRLQSQAEERKIHERKGLQLVKELKRQLTQEKSRADTLQQRMEELLSQPPTPMNSDIEAPADPLSTSSSTNGNSNSSNCNNSRANQEISSVGSWSFVPPKSKLGNVAPNETMSLCSIGSEDRETVQQPCNAGSEESMQRNASITSETSRQDKLSSTGDVLHEKQPASPAPSTKSNPSFAAPTSTSSHQNINETLLMEEQAALVDRLTKMQHDKWMLEEKLSYLEQANSALSEDLANKSHVIKSYFLGQAQNSKQYDHSSGFSSSEHVTSRRASIPIKKVVDFLKERSQIPLGLESDNLSKEATKKMQVMLEETLIKCIKLQENLDYVTSELNKLKS